MSFNLEQYHFWSTFGSFSKIIIDTAAVFSDLNTAMTSIVSHLEAKQAAPLERMTIDQKTRDAIAVYEKHHLKIASINKRIMESNERISRIKKQVEEGDPASILGDLSRLRASKSRYSSLIAPLCDDYLMEKDAKARTEEKRDQAKDELEEYREDVFPRYQDGVNDYLEKFNTGFRLEKLTSRNTSGGPTSTYNLEINNRYVAVAGGRSLPGKHSFSNTLSAGDRSTIALAFFFESINQRSNIESMIVVIDDPISSLDDHRSWATVTEVRQLVDRARTGNHTFPQQAVSMSYLGSS